MWITLFALLGCAEKSKDTGEVLEDTRGDSDSEGTDTESTGPNLGSRKE